LRTSAITPATEASSFQLEDTLAFAPEAAVLLNLAPDHADRHPQDEPELALARRRRLQRDHLAGE